MLSQIEQDTYSRHLLLDEIGVEGQIKLKHARVLVIGAGGLGCPVLQYLCAAGVGTIGISDHDVVETSNLHRQILFGTSSKGKSKALEAKKRLQEMNPSVEINSYTDGTTIHSIETQLSKYDWIVDCTDNYQTRYLINDACVLYNKTLIYAAIYKFEGQVSVFNHNQGPTYRCIYPERPSASATTNCSESGVLGVLPGMIGTLQANEVLKLILEIGSPLSGKLLLFNALNNKSNVFTISKTNPEIYEHIKINGLNAEAYKIHCKTMNTKRITLVDFLKNPSSFEQIIDVREYHETPDMSDLSTLHIPLSDFENQIHKINPTKKTLVFCQKGIRSQMAIDVLQQNGSFNALYNLSGGVYLYQKQKSTL